MQVEEIQVLREDEWPTSSEGVQGGLKKRLALVKLDENAHPSRVESGSLDIVQLDDGNRFRRVSRTERKKGDKELEKSFALVSMEGGILNFAAEDALLQSDMCKAHVATLRSEGEKIAGVRCSERLMDVVKMRQHKQAAKALLLAVEYTYEASYKDAPEEGWGLDHYAFSLVAAAAEDLLDAAENAGKETHAEGLYRLMAEVFENVADTVEEDASTLGLADDDLVTTTLNFYQACLSDKGEPNRERVRAVIAEWAVTLKHRHIRNAEGGHPFAFSINSVEDVEQRLEVYRNCWHRFPGYFEDTPHIRRHVWLSMKGDIAKARRKEANAWQRPRISVDRCLELLESL